jgi:hypothetical protein
VTVNAKPAIVTVPVRAAPVFEATLNVTEPFPVPVAPATTVIHGASLVAVREQPAPPPMATVIAAPAAATASLERSSVNTQFGDAGVLEDWVSVTVWPATRRAALRVPPPLGSTRRLTSPLPVPLVAVIAIQPASTEACQLQPARVLTAIVTVPPPAATVWVAGVTS